MRIAVIGAGNVGGTLGGRWTAAGHDVVYGVRDPSDASVSQLPQVATVQDAVDGADVVLIALPWSATQPVTSALQVGDAIVIDATNPLSPNAGALVTDPSKSGAELVREWLGGGRVVKAFNTTGAGNMANPDYGSQSPIMPVASDDDDAKAVVISLANEIGFEGIDAGPLAAASDLEHLALLWIRLAYVLGNGPNIALTLMRR